MLNQIKDYYIRRKEKKRLEQEAERIRLLIRERYATQDAMADNMAQYVIISSISSHTAECHHTADVSSDASSSYSGWSID